ncbi:MAG: phospholipid/cholesterol/gamma-HCH transport system substrate-binding protein [Pseudonocardiales bacterium]|nr:phospholipid/cholesterol/gamma-HCH transport system substrate-binding protein [Pseudonocardiales bacterium]
MPKESLMEVTKRRLLGVLFIALVAALVSLSILIYNKAFTDTVDVTLKANHIGNQLIIDSDVKERGIIVGSVKAVRANGENAIVTLALTPSRAQDIPKNVSAQILPKTLFGEQYVSLIIPDHPSAHIAAGDTIPQDLSKGALETQTVLDHLYPLLTAIRPADLNATLTAVATALKNRGAKLGQTLVNFDQYLKAINPHTKQLVDDLKKLGQVAVEYNGVAPDIFDSLKNLQTSAKTVIAKRQALDNLFTTGADTSVVLQGFLDQNKQRLITLNDQNNKIFPLLARYSPEFTCLFSGINKLVGLANKAIYDNQIHLSVTLDATNMGKYKPGEQPKLIKNYGPNCFGLPDNPQPIVNGSFQVPDKYRCINDGAALTADPCGKRPSAAGYTAVGSAEETALVNTLVSGEMGTTPDKVPAATTLLAAPLLRGHEVVSK